MFILRERVGGGISCQALSSCKRTVAKSLFLEAVEQQSEREPAHLPIRVMIAHGHPIVRSGLRDRLERASGITVVCEAETGREVLSLVQKENPDVLLLDVVMPKESDQEVTETLMKQSPPPRILALSSHNETEYVWHLMERGASGYLTKEQVSTHTVEAVRAVARGKAPWFVSSVPDVTSLRARLTDREQEVLSALAEGYSNQELAELLNVSENTIRTHTSQIYKKLNVSSARRAISLAWRSGFMRVKSS